MVCADFYELTKNLTAYRLADSIQSNEKSAGSEMKDLVRKRVEKTLNELLSKEAEELTARQCMSVRKTVGDAAEVITAGN